ncbi:DUF3659 domain-containing protein [Aspergillus aculeatinus CBS 121060]|uniref:Uncharacterized protein n=1 Tax=Aspergillus aculeatinus CBS 121060 TaxID=1448322 RepID=A0ACD1GU28_9EURO|nr:hypothetical protein BO66DRAFT_415692 [Aspergillus aculeatinus CBS 121060]RAH64681.1 hypothetical protein BO66DRAFT_415692 [Aspergillus aculeatinus CBS 121060]
MATTPPPDEPASAAEETTAQGQTAMLPRRPQEQQQKDIFQAQEANDTSRALQRQPRRQRRQQQQQEQVTSASDTETSVDESIGGAREEQQQQQQQATTTLRGGLSDRDTSAVDIPHEMEGSTHSSQEQRQSMRSGSGGAEAGGSKTSPRSSMLARGKTAADRLGRFTQGVRSMGHWSSSDAAQKAQSKLGGGAQQAKGMVPAQEDTAGSGLEDVQGSVLSLASLEGLSVEEGGMIMSSAGQPIGEVVEGDPDDLVGQTVGKNGEILDEDGDLIGRVQLLEKEAEPALPDMPTSEEGVSQDQVGQEQAQEGIKMEDATAPTEPDQPVEEPQASDADQSLEEPPASEADQTLQEQQPGEEEEIAGEGLAVPESAQDKEGKEGAEEELTGDKEVGAGVEEGVGEGVGEEGVGEGIGEEGVGEEEARKEGEEEGEEGEEEAPKLPDISTLEGLTCTKFGGILIEGDAKKIFRGKYQLDDQGQFWDQRGKVVGKARPLPVEEDELGPFADLGDLHVAEEGWVVNEEGRRVGQVVEGDARKLRGRAVDEDGDILDRRGNPLGRAEPWEEPSEAEAEEPEEPEEEGEDLSILAGKKVNKLGNVVDDAGVVYGRLVAGNPRKLAGKSVDEEGQVWDSAGRVVGQAELLPAEERDRPEGPFSGLEGLVVGKDGLVIDENGDTVGRLVSGDPQRLRGRAVDEDGEILDKSGNAVGQAEPWSPEEPTRNVSPMAGRKVNRDGEVRDEDGNVIGKLTQGELSNLIGRTVDENGYVVDNDGNKIGECTLLENIPPEPEPEPESEPELEPELSPEEREKQAREERDRELAKKMASIVQQTLDSIEPLCKQITQHIERANSTPKEELDEEQLVKQVKPLIEEAGNGLQECKGALRALDPDGQIAAQAKARSASAEASPEEHHLAEVLKELTRVVGETIERGKALIADMPHAKKKINPLWTLLSEPLVQIIAAVGLLLSGVLGLVGKLLNGLGLGNLLSGLLGGLGVDKLLEGLGLGKITEGLGLGGKK